MPFLKLLKEAAGEIMVGNFFACLPLKDKNSTEKALTLGGKKTGGDAWRKITMMAEGLKVGF